MWKIWWKNLSCVKAFILSKVDWKLARCFFSYKKVVTFTKKHTLWPLSHFVTFCSWYCTGGPCNSWTFYLRIRLFEVQEFPNSCYTESQAPRLKKYIKPWLSKFSQLLSWVKYCYCEEALSVACLSSSSSNGDQINWMNKKHIFLDLFVHWRYLVFQIFRLNRGKISVMSIFGSLFTT